MLNRTTRRTLLGSAAAVAAASTWDWLASPPLRAAEPATSLPQPHVNALYPTQDPDLVSEMVGVSHGNVARVRKLLEERPSLARAAWDWGFGDWESALGAASHMGNREIAELLLAHGARPSIFSAAMLGQLEVVQAFVAASPGVQRILGPHGITLLAHARAGGPAAEAVLGYLEALGDADPRPTLSPLLEADRDRLAGTYRFGSGETERIEVSLDRGYLYLERAGGTRRGLSHLGGNEFFPAGAHAVRIRFLVTDGRATSLTIYDPGPVLEAQRL